MSKRNMHRLELTIKDKNIWKTHLLLRISAVIGRYGPYLMILMLFVTQNNFKFKTVQKFPTVSLDFTQGHLTRRCNRFRVVV